MSGKAMRQVPADDFPALEESTMISYLVQTVKAYFQDPEHRKEFEEWYKKTYGTDYVWRS